MQKVCSKCDCQFSIEQFYKRKSGERAGEYYERCKECFKDRGRKYYHQNHDRQLAFALLRKARYKNERRRWLEEIKNRPCLDCGKIYPPWVMDFDHRDGDQKLHSISWMALRNTSNFEKIKLEIAKCDLVCANCHRQRTHNRVSNATVAKLVKALV